MDQFEVVAGAGSRRSTGGGAVRFHREAEAPGIGVDGVGVRA